MSKMSLSVQPTAMTLPDPAKSSQAALVNACRAVYAQRDTLIGGLSLFAADVLRRQSTAIETFLRGTEAYPDAQRAARVLEMAVGAALGATWTRLSSSADELSKDERSEFRQLNKGRDNIEPYLETDGLSREAALRIANGKWAPGALMTSDTAEWYTPRDIIDRSIAAMGAIDLDPCSNKIGEPRVPASLHYTATQDGLTQPWLGRVYMNPPYGGKIGQWVDKLADEFDAGNVTEAIALVPARTDTSWWAHLPSGIVCMVTGRLTFSDHPTPAPFPSAVCYLGPNQQRFAEAFITLGIIYVRLEMDASA